MKLVQKHHVVTKTIFFLILLSGFSVAQTQIPFFDVNVRPASGQEEVSLSLQVLLLLSILSLAPSIIIMTTSFMRVAIILKFTQRALSLQQEPPAQVIMGMALFISFFIMKPTLNRIYDEAYKPYTAQEISTSDFISRAGAPLKDFMFKHTRQKDIDLFLYLSKQGSAPSREEIGLEVLVPSFIISELTTAFTHGIFIFIPFIVIDMIVASILMSMGMIMIPPVMVSLIFKIILFVLLDGWHLVTRNIVYGYL